jgi:hypothetical protein
MIQPQDHTVTALYVEPALYVDCSADPAYKSPKFALRSPEKLGA